MDSKNIITEGIENSEKEIEKTNSTISFKIEHLVTKISPDEEQVKVKITGKTSDHNGYGTDGYQGFVIEVENEEAIKTVIKMIEEANEEYGPALKVTKIPKSNKLIITNNTIDIVYTDLALKELLKASYGYFNRSLLKLLMTHKPIEILEGITEYRGRTPYIPPNFDNTGKNIGL